MSLFGDLKYECFYFSAFHTKTHKKWQFIKQKYSKKHSFWQQDGPYEINKEVPSAYSGAHFTPLLPVPCSVPVMDICPQQLLIQAGTILNIKNTISNNQIHALFLVKLVLRWKTITWHTSIAHNYSFFHQSVPMHICPEQIDQTLHTRFWFTFYRGNFFLHLAIS